MSSLGKVCFQMQIYFLFTDLENIVDQNFPKVSAKVKIYLKSWNLKQLNKECHKELAENEQEEFLSSNQILKLLKASINQKQQVKEVMMMK